MSARLKKALEQAEDERDTAMLRDPEYIPFDELEEIYLRRKDDEKFIQAVIQDPLILLGLGEEQ